MIREGKRMRGGTSRVGTMHLFYRKDRNGTTSSARIRHSRGKCNLRRGGRASAYLSFTTRLARTANIFDDFGAVFAFVEMVNFGPLYKSITARGMAR